MYDRQATVRTPQPETTTELGLGHPSTSRNTQITGESLSRLSPSRHRLSNPDI
jgi:hypothetical protein